MPRRIRPHRLLPRCPAVLVATAACGIASCRGIGEFDGPAVARASLPDGTVSEAGESPPAESATRSVEVVVPEESHDRVQPVVFEDVSDGPPVPPPPPEPEANAPLPKDPRSATEREPEPETGASGAKDAESEADGTTHDVPESPPQGEPAPTTRLSLADFEAMALEHNPSLAVAGFTVRDRRGVLTQVGLKPNPIVGYAANEIGEAGEGGQQGAFLNQTFVTGRKLALNRAVARWDVEEAGWIAETQRFRVLNDVRTAFYEALGAERRIELARELVDLAEQGVETSQALVDAQQAARPDLLQAEVQLSEFRIALRNAEIEYEAAWNRLVSLAGRPHLAPTPLSGELLEELPEVEWEPAYATLSSLSPELQRAEVRVRRAKSLIARQTAEPIPNVLAQLNVAQDTASHTTLAGVQLGLPLPIHNANQGNVRAAIAEYHRAVRDLERIRLGLREELAVTVREFSQARQQVVRYREEIVPKSRESFELIAAGYRQGEFDFLRVLTARRIYFESQLAAVRALVELNRAHVNLEGLLLTGGLDPVPVPQEASGLRGQALSGR